MRDTIFAPATAAGRAAVAVVRVSGPDASVLTRALCGGLPKPRRASLRRLRSNDVVIDEALVLWMPGPTSFTAEDCVEFQLHGGPAVVEGLCTALAGAGARLAVPGEFTRRAFEAGRLDLTQAEAVADLVDAETEAQRTQAVAQLSGVLSDRYRQWRETLFDALALLEAAIDFPEDDLPGGVASLAIPLIEQVASDIARELSGARGQRVREGLRVAVVGAPNVGKSSLLNALADREAAIVTPMAGTTRDIVEVHLVMAGQAIRLADTAGLRDSQDVIEVEGVRRARAWADEADLRIAVSDASRPETFALAEAISRENDILVINKADLVARTSHDARAVVTIASSGEVGELRERLERTVSAMAEGRDFPAITRQRHRALLTECAESLDRALRQRDGAELTGEDVRLAVRALERGTGRSDPEAVLDRVFSTFCIGK